MEAEQRPGRSLQPLGLSFTRNPVCTGWQGSFLGCGLCSTPENVLLVRESPVRSILTFQLWWSSGVCTGFWALLPVRHLGDEEGVDLPRRMTCCAPCNRIWRLKQSP